MTIAQLDGLDRKAVPSIREYLLSPQFFGVKRLGGYSSLSKDDILTAEVSLPLVEPCAASDLRVVMMRRPYSRDAEPILVAVSRLPAP